MRFVRLALELGMKLAGNEKRMVLQFNNLHEFAVRRSAAENESLLLEQLAIGVVELVPMAMALVDQERAVKMRRQRAHAQLAWLRTKPHGAALLCDFLLLVEK